MIDIKPKILHHPYGEYSHKQIYGYFEHEMAIQDVQ